MLLAKKMIVSILPTMLVYFFLSFLFVVL